MLRFGTFVLVLGLAILPSQAEIVDRILAVAGSRVITWSAALAETNYQALRDGQEPPRWGSPADPITDEARQVVSRLVDQALLEQAMARSPFSTAPDEDAQSPLRELEQRFGGPAAFRQALARYHLSEEEVAARMARERHLLAFIDVTLRPQVRVSAEQVEEYYQSNFLPEVRRQQDSVPDLPQVRDRIEEILAEREINRRLERWLEDLRRSTAVQVWPE